MKRLLFFSLFLALSPLRAEVGESALAGTLQAKEPEWASLGVTLGALVILGIVIGVVASNSSSS
jgi:hypothetical protein